MSGFSSISRDSPRAESVADSWTVVREDEDSRHSDERVTMHYLERISNLEKSLQLVELEYKESQKRVKVLTDLVQDLKKVGRDHHKSWTDIFENDRKMREEIKNENDELYGDMENARRLVPVASGDIRVPHPVDLNCMEEEIILRLLTRADVERTNIEIQMDGRVRLIIVQEGSSRMRKCFMRNSRGEYYNIADGVGNLLQSWRGDRPLVHLHLGSLTVTNFGARGPMPPSLTNVLKRALIDTAVFVGFTCLDDLRWAIRFNGESCPV